MSLIGTREARDRPPRCGAWLSGRMVSAREAVSTYGKLTPSHTLSEVVASKLSGRY
jgi:hypothetical protein